jgi:hypothetical protein
METGGEAVERNRKKQVTYFSLPPDFACEDITAYIYNHYSSLLTDEEAAAHRIRMFRVKAIGSRNPDSVFKAKLAAIQGKHPALWRRIEEQGIGKVMDAAAQRVLREHADTIFLNRCSRCNALCRTPKALQCLHCGHDWHSAEA